MYEQLVNNKTKLSVVGLGYVGLPLALEFANNMSVIGFDINTEKICRMQQNIDPSQEITAEKFQNKKIVFTSEIEKLKEASFHIIAVPTPIDKYNQPDLSPLLSATSIVGSILKKGDYVVYEPNQLLGFFSVWSCPGYLGYQLSRRSPKHSTHLRGPSTPKIL